MNDDVKKALESLRREMADGDPDWWKRECLVFAHIDGEPARQAAALENLREACALEAIEALIEAGEDPRAADSLGDRLRDVPLDATPMDHRIAELEDELALAQMQIGTMLRRKPSDALVAENEALRAQTTVSDGPCVECGESTQWAAANPEMWPVMLPTEAEPGVVKHHHVKCVLGWKAQVAAARAECASITRVSVNREMDEFEDGSCAAAKLVLRAMDEAKNE